MLGSGDKDIQQGNGKMHNTAFTWQGVSHALLHQKSFITQLQVAGSAQGMAGDLVSACPANPSIPQLPSCCWGQQPFNKAKYTKEQQGP